MPPNFVEEAARLEDWKKSEWCEWLSVGRAAFKRYGVKELRFVEFPPTIWATGDRFEDTHVRLDPDVPQPTRRALHQLGEKLAQLTGDKPGGAAPEDGPTG